MPFSGSEKTRLGLYGATRSPYSDFSGKVAASLDIALLSGMVAVRPIGVLAIGTIPGANPVELPDKCNTWETDDNGRLWTAGRDDRTWYIPGKCK